MENEKSATLTDSNEECPTEASQDDVDAAIEELEADEANSEDLIIGS